MQQRAIVNIIEESSNMGLGNKLKSARKEILFQLGLRKIDRNEWQKWGDKKIRGFLRSEQEGIDSPSRRKIREILLQFPGATLLDVACGPAVELEGYKRHGVDVDYTGMDATAKMIDYALQIFPQGKFRLGDITNIDAADNSFDLVLARHIFEHLPHYREGLNECLRVAKRAVIVNFFIELSSTERDIITTRGKNYHNNCYSRKLFEDFLTGTLKVRSFENFRNLGSSIFSQNEIYLIHK
ncbi:MAG TPA: class I SAM-dependent methyltransferase [Candidatus Binatia bacterium]|nr:class I SAM-dependent methyltransferase [Candidatus Binatia bacterium]